MSIHCHSDRIKSNLFWLSARKRRAVLLGLRRDPGANDNAPFCRVGVGTAPRLHLCLPYQDPRCHLLPPWELSRHRGLAGVEATAQWTLDWLHYFQLHGWILLFWYRGASDNIATLSDYRKVSRYGRHNYILGVSCVPDKNSLRPIDGFRGSLYPDPPYFASLQDKLLGLETRSKPLAENQILQSTGSSCANPCWIGWKGERKPSCPGGPHELSTVILGDGEYEIG